LAGGGAGGGGDVAGIADLAIGLVVVGHGRGAVVGERLAGGAERTRRTARRRGVPTARARRAVVGLVVQRRRRPRVVEVRANWRHILRITKVRMKVPGHSSQLAAPVADW